MSQPAQLLAALTQEESAVKAFVQLLQQEQALLTENNMDELSKLAELKLSSAMKLNELAEVCRTQLSTISPKLDNTAITAWFKANNARGLTLWLDVRTLAQQAKELNNINGELIQMKLRHNQQTFAALNRAVSQADVYGADGQASFTPGTGRSLGSV